jgi:hypothetical protein
LTHSAYINPEYACQPASAWETAFRHSGWKHRRRLVFQHLGRLHSSSAKLDAFCNCGSAAWVQHSRKADRFRIAANFCHHRLCDPCARARANNIARNVAAHIGQKKVRFITLTIRHNRNPLRDQIDRLYKCFAQLRRRNAWLAHVEGGAAFLEVKWKPESKQWHPHLHCIVEGAYFPQRDLARDWYAVTGDSFIVDVRDIHEPKEAAAYCAKYATKGVDNAVFEHADALDEYGLAIRGRRLCATFGSWRGLKLESLPEDPGDWRNVCSLDELMEALKDAEPWAIALWKARTHHTEAAPGP